MKRKKNIGKTNQRETSDIVTPDLSRFTTNALGARAFTGVSPDVEMEISEDNEIHKKKRGNKTSNQNQKYENINE